MVTEYTIASTSQMLNPRTKRFEKELLDVADIKKEQFGRFVFPGEPIGVLTEEVQKLQVWELFLLLPLPVMTQVQP